MIDNCFTILGIEPVSDKRAIKRAYASKAKEFHPEEHPEQFQQIREAYERALVWNQENTAKFDTKLEASTTPKKSDVKLKVQEADNLDIVVTEKEPEPVLVDKIFLLEQRVKEIQSRCMYVYGNLSLRRDWKYWWTLLEEIFSEDGYKDLILESLLDFFKNHYYMPTSVWIFIRYKIALPGKEETLYGPYFNLQKFVNEQLAMEKYNYDYQYFNGEVSYESIEKFFYLVQRNTHVMNDGELMSSWIYSEFVEQLGDITKKDPEFYLLLAYHTYLERNENTRVISHFIEKENKKPIFHFIEKAKEADKYNNRVNYYTAYFNRLYGDRKYALQLAKKLYIINHLDLQYVLLYAEGLRATGDILLAMRLYRQFYLNYGAETGYYFTSHRILEDYQNDKEKILFVIDELKEKLEEKYSHAVIGESPDNYIALYRLFYQSSNVKLREVSESLQRDSKKEQQLLGKAVFTCLNEDKNRDDEGKIAECIQDIIAESSLKELRQLWKKNPLAKECYYLLFCQVIDLYSKYWQGSNNIMTLISFMEKNQLFDVSIQEKLRFFYQRRGEWSEWHQYCLSSQKSQYSMNIHIDRYLGEACYKLGRWEEAVKYLSKYIEQIEKDLIFDSNAHQMLSLVYCAMGENTQTEGIAEKEYAKAIIEAIQKKNQKKD